MAIMADTARAVGIPASTLSLKTEWQTKAFIRGGLIFVNFEIKKMHADGPVTSCLFFTFLYDPSIQVKNANDCNIPFGL